MIRDMKSNLTDKILNIYNSSTGLPADSLELDQPLGLDSIQRLMLASALEAEFDINIDLERFSDSTTFNDLIGFLE